MNAIEQLKSVLCDPEGKCCIRGSDEDRAIVDRALQALALTEQEPVLVVEKEPDYMSRGHFYTGTKPYIDPTKVWSLPVGTKLYTTPPPQRKPLTDEMRKQMKERCDSMEMRGAFADGWLSAEAAHNIKE